MTETKVTPESAAINAMSGCVSVKRLETTAQFCNYEIEVHADIMLGEDCLGNLSSAIRAVRERLDAEVNQAVADAIAQKKAEREEVMRRYRAGFQTSDPSSTTGDPEDPF